MPFLTPDSANGPYDVIVVGSGAAGGQAAYTLALEGVKVLMLEAGRNYNAGKETPMFQTNGQAPLAGAETPDKPLGFYDSTVNGGWWIPDEPYTNAAKNEDDRYLLWRARMLGGRANHWARNALRNGPYDFKARSRDGLGLDWPIGYEDVAPYYDKVEMLIGVYGTNEGLENTPDSPDGILLPPPKPRIGELLARQRGRRIGVPIIPIHRAVLSRQQDWRSIPAKLHPGNARAQRLVAESMRSRSACLWATHCQRGCGVGANYQSITVHLPPALASGNLDILPNAMAREVSVGPDGRATGVTYIDKTTGRERHVGARAVVLAAGSCETIRLLLNSRSNRYPDGVGNGNGLVGRHIMDTVGTTVGGQVPLLENLPLMNEDGAGGDHLYAPWWLYREQLAGKLGFARGYHIEFATGRKMPTLAVANSVDQLGHRAYGPGFKEDARRYYGSFVSFSGRGEMISNDKSFCQLDPVVKDKWGVPVLQFHWEWSRHEIGQAIHMQTTFAALIEAMGGKVRTRLDPKRGAILPGGHVKHGVGGALMGRAAGSSVTDSWGQLWDARNVFIADGATFCSNADKNPTLTILALAWRTADRLLERLRRHEL